MEARQETINELLLYLKPKLKGTRWRPITIVGPPESGKTNTAYFITKLLIEQFGEDKLNIVLARKLKTAIKNLDQKPVQVLLIDDAVRHQYSRFSVSQEGRLVIANYYEIRHILNKYKRKHRDAVVYILFITQRWRDLSPQFREAPLVLFKGTLTSFYNNRDIRKHLGEEYYKILRNLTKRIYLYSDDSAKEDAIAYTAWEDRYYIQGIKLVKDLKLEFVDESEEPEDIAEDLARVILNHFGKDTLTLPNSVLKGFLRRFAIDHGYDVVYLDAIDIAKYLAYEKFGSPTEISDREIKEIAEKLTDKIIQQDKLDMWYRMDPDERIGFILYEYPYLRSSIARDIIKIIDFLLLDMGVIKKEPLLSTGEAARILGLSPRTIINYIRDGTIQDAIMTPGGHFRIPLSSVIDTLKKIGKNEKNEKL